MWGNCVLIFHMYCWLPLLLELRMTSSFFFRENQAYQVYRDLLVLKEARYEWTFNALSWLYIKYIVEDSLFVHHWGTPFSVCPYREKPELMELAFQDLKYIYLKFMSGSIKFYVDSWCSSVIHKTLICDLTNKHLIFLWYLQLFSLPLWSNNKVVRL